MVGQADRAGNVTALVRAAQISTLTPEALAALAELARVSATNMSEHAVIAILDLTLRVLRPTAEASPIIPLPQFATESMKVALGRQLFTLGNQHPHALAALDAVVEAAVTCPPPVRARL